MKKYAILVQEAIAAAKNQNWSEAVDLNQEILTRNTTDIGALNRMGVAYMQLSDISKAKDVFQNVVELDKSNIIAKKHLANIKNKQIGSLSLAQTYFIEEPGKTKITELHRLTRKDSLKKLQVGQKCLLVIRGKHISVETTDGLYVGSLPDDLSFRLCKLIQRGNEYECLIHTLTESNCAVHLQETKTSSKNKHILSFPVGKIHTQNNNPEIINPMDEEFLIEEDIPMDLDDEEVGDVESNDFETTLEKINNGEEV
ncbi:MAG: hypothetical protein COU63_04060 [Candidatus Pacebacteria bacterium CG10_big_fil_rev_8_21_14_0_10_36_11]|nr:hypothetical protein [Candidatus Pacearchaeota archaeon]OIP74070.1 MAG: hypothetical protein AUK08_02335 [Candidatus Pacebacteria bacterium CG2_30_36_39]PIR64437.1 MAG: hypothetical protein COU63_04060 [Candidatus Pacebacteria bacterium CG10_big_fil_rev_8_21_14_0_10_36_11]PJC42774.1 MAG: hypothetical protein CO040_02700 [Candidatus Pacebacteria bacterium CG_4_9_14_0_2_um_filter_36_8]